MSFAATSVSPDGTRVAGFCQPQQWGIRPPEKPFVAIWETATGRRIAKLPIEDGWRLAFTADGRRLVAAGPTELTVWDVPGAVRVRAHPLPDPLGRRWQSNRWEQSGVESLAVSGDGKTAATGHADGTILVWDVTPGPARPDGR